MKYLTSFLMFFFLLVSETHAQDPAAVMTKAQDVENRARQQAQLNSIAPNAADLLLNQYNKATVRTGPNIVASLPISAGPSANSVSPPALKPPDLKAGFFGDWPNTGFCEFWLAPSDQRYFAPPGCNDKVSGVRVPFGLTARICEHDGEGPAGWGLCRDFPPGDHFVGNDLNDRGTSFWVTDKQMTFYFTSAADEVPPAFRFAVNYKGNLDGNGQLSVDLNFDQTWYTKTYEYRLPQWCMNPQLWEATKANAAEWQHQLSGGVLRIVLRVKDRVPFGPNNWVGVGVRCT
jgi:hypothetical protein